MATESQEYHLGTMRALCATSTRGCAVVPVPVASEAHTIKVPSAILCNMRPIYNRLEEFGCVQMGIPNISDMFYSSTMIERNLYKKDNDS